MHHHLVVHNIAVECRFNDVNLRLAFENASFIILNLSAYHKNVVHKH